jgi:hypothetical protein
MALTTFQGPVRSMGGFYSQGPYSVVELTADTVINPTDHAGKIILINNSTLTLTLPTINSDTPVKSAGPYHKGGEPNTLSNVGISYKFIFLTSSGANTTIQMTTATNLFTGSIVQGKAGLGLVHVFEPNGSSNNALVFDGTTTGGVAGTEFTITAIYANKYHIQGVNLGSGTLATPFSG